MAPLPAARGRGQLIVSDATLERSLSAPVESTADTAKTPVPEAWFVTTYEDRPVFLTSNRVESDPDCVP